MKEHSAVLYKLLLRTSSSLMMANCFFALNCFSLFSLMMGRSRKSHKWHIHNLGQADRFKLCSWHLQKIESNACQAWWCLWLTWQTFTILWILNLEPSLVQCFTTSATFDDWCILSVEIHSNKSTEMPFTVVAESPLGRFVPENNKNYYSSTENDSNCCYQ